MAEASHVKLVKRSPRFIVVLCAAAFALGFLTGGDPVEPSSASSADATHAGHAHMLETAAGPPLIDTENLKYICPMMCVPPMDKAGQCPVCGMELTLMPSGQDAASDGPPRMRLSGEAIRRAGIRLAPATRRFAEAEVKLYGQIDFDPAHMTRITAFMPGVVDRVYVKRAGQFVRWGDPLFDIYSSDLLDAQTQLIEAMKWVPGFLAFRKGSPHAARDVRVTPNETAEGGPEAQQALETIKAIRHKLRILGLPKRDVDELMKVGEATGIATVYASMYGQVIDQNAFEGTYVNTGAPLFTLADPQYVWLRLDAYEIDYPWIRKGQQVEFSLDAYPGETFNGKIVYIDPVFNPQRRTFEIGVISTDDRGGRMKAGMLARATVHARLGADGRLADAGDPAEDAPLMIPDTAPLITGKRAVVYVASADRPGEFTGREVILGPRGRDGYVVLEGLSEGEQVVVNGNFKIDSAVQIVAHRGMMDMEDGHEALTHHKPGGSEGMAADYRTDRARSRVERPPTSTPQADAFRSRMAPTHSDGGHASRTRNHSVQRRKPGMYGDPTRPRAVRQDR